MKLHTPLLLSFALVVSLWFVSGPLSYMTRSGSERASSPAAVVATSVHVVIPKSASGVAKQVALSQKQLLALADNMYQDGVVPLGDYKYSTTVAKKGTVFLCNARKENPGSMVNGPWIDGKTWSFSEKLEISGAVTWPNATFKNTVSGSVRTLTTNALPISHTTGVFPVAITDPAAAYDRNPNTISAQIITQKLPLNPVYSETPYCMGGEVGIMLTGVPLFNAFDAGLRDAPAHELQDSCDGHPQGTGEYHYHGLSSCIQNTNIDTVIGYAYDGFPITGSKVADGKYLTTDDLDECHGITSDVIIDGKKKSTYHYVMTVDFPYSASCFRAKPVTTGPSGGAMQQGSSVRPQLQRQVASTTQARPSPLMPVTQQQQPVEQTIRQGPPQEALTACADSSHHASCSFTGGRGEVIVGLCDTPPGSTAPACIPQR